MATQWQEYISVGPFCWVVEEWGPYYVNNQARLGFNQFFSREGEFPPGFGVRRPPGLTVRDCTSLSKPYYVYSEGSDEFVDSKPPFVSCWADFADYYHDPDGMPLPFGTERRRFGRGQQARDYYVDHCRYGGPVRSWTLPRGPCFLWDFNSPPTRRRGLPSREASERLVSLWAELLDLNLERLDPSHAGSQTPQELLVEDDIPFVLCWLADKQLTQVSLLGRLQRSLRLKKALHDPWARLGGQPPEPYLSLKIITTSEECTISSSEQWKTLLNRTDCNSATSPFTGTSSTLVIFDLGESRQDLIGRYYDFIFEAALCRIMFHTSPSAFATAIRHFEEGISTDGIAPVLTRYSSYAALGLRSASVCFTVTTGQHFNFASDRYFYKNLVVMSINLSGAQMRETGSLHALKKKVFDTFTANHSDLRNVFECEDDVPFIIVRRSLVYYIARAWLRVHWGFHVFNPDSSIAFRKESNQWDNLSRIVLDLKSAATNIKGWLNIHDPYNEGEPSMLPAPGSEIAQEISFAREYAIALEEANLLREALTIQSTQLSIRETQRGIALSEQSLVEAHAVGRLTQLAFLFLPLTFITSIFGMNVKPFSEGAPMWQFWVTTFCLLVPFWTLGIMTARNDIAKRVPWLGQLRLLASPVSTNPFWVGSLLVSSLAEDASKALRYVLVALRLKRRPRKPQTPDT